jgi:Caspase domain
MWRLLVLVAVVCAGVLGTAAPAMADKRVALVIGNSGYQNVNKLPNPAKDAAAIAAMLTKIGFDVVNNKEDATNADMRKMVRDFSEQAANADVALVYYAGHGIELNGTNYLIPVDARLERDVDVEDETVSLDRIVRILDPVKKLRLVILDACRDDPFQQTMKRSLSTRGVTRGLAKVEPENPNTLIAYAAKAGSTASDGAGDHSPFTTALLKQLPTPGQDLRKSLGYVRDDVMKQTDNQQEPFVYGSLGGDDVVLVPGASPAAAPIPASVAALDPNSQLRQDYELAAQVNTKAGWEAFIKNHSGGFYADLARAALGKLTDAPPAQLAATNPNQRNLSPASPSDHAQPGAAGSINAFVGKSFRVTFNEVQEQDSPNPGKIGYASREGAIYIKAADQITSRFGLVARMSSTGRYASAAPGAVNNGMQVDYDGHQFLLIVQAPDHRVLVTFTPNGNTCSASISYALMEGKTFYTFRSTATGDLVLMRKLSADRVVCWISPTDEVGEPPVASVQPAAATPPSSPAPSTDTSPPTAPSQPATPAPTAAASDACTKIQAACESAGFVFGEKSVGAGLIKDCYAPIVEREPQPAIARKHPLPKIDPAVVDACRSSRTLPSASAQPRK